ncbi:glycosyltransferase [Terrimonas pollutisoli]|uniref:glycosyltransferase n=1 Tax=Terrimonas pollutisoli TaxID=3034147 RepID=UPI0023EAF5AC|nr:glycosyltransferase [Terrimonas sp. H1YJ31]
MSIKEAGHSIPQPFIHSSLLRPVVKGKFIMLGNEKFYIKGVTYGTFRPNEKGIQFPDTTVIEKDFSQMAMYGINTVRTYTTPPGELLDIAGKYGLKVMVGLPWEQHITFLDSNERKQSIVNNTKKYVAACAGHPAILCYSIGNEIPAPIVRYYGKQKIEQFLHKLYAAVKSVDPEGLVTYVNYPTTEYLKLPFLDFDCFNVYLETQEKLNAYLQRLHNITGDRPLVLAEIGLDSMRNGVEKQSEILDWQLRTIFAKGSAGAFVFAWTDEWWRGGFDIEDWDFGLVDRQRNPKPALDTVAKAFADIPFQSEQELPLISVVVCSYNGSATIRDCMEGLQQLNYPNYEVIVVNDGSKDRLAEIVSEYPVRLISTSNRGLSNARNTGMLEAKGEIVAYIDDDAYPDKDWLRYLAYAYQTTPHAAIGGPNIAPDNDGPIATCVANAPGGPVHVLLTDEIAEHIPGCNMSFRKDILLELGGFDPIYRAAGDDVDLCWRIQHTGRTIGFHPAAFVWHHRRNSLKAYWKQQKGYGKAEALLEAKWPEKYNGFGHLSWAGRIYGNGITLPIKLKKDKIFHGIWGSAPFQSVYQQAPGFISCIPLMPEWYLLVFILCFLSFLGLSWLPLLWLLPFLFIALTISILQAGISAAKSLSTKKFESKKQYLKYWGLTTVLHIVQPFARLYGRIAHGLAPWRKRGSNRFHPSLLFKSKLTLKHWSETWKSAEQWLQEIENNLLQSRVRVRRGGQYDQWDLHVTCGFFASAKGLLTIEEHGGNKQLLRFKCQPEYSATGIQLTLVLSILSSLAFFDSSYLAGGVLALFSVGLIITYFTDKARAMYDLSEAFKALPGSEDLIMPITEKVFQQETKMIESQVAYVQSLVQEDKIVKNYSRRDFREKRVLEILIENN